ncbi:uncharacterized protein LOC123699840 [Colias croceus]|uniref:uncharacterized protein LOC123699840 n=1 Tax=Colias crocea TaxID=72248 RepID=UPI001E2815B0|nr:uncharacterized protein LOC123699840 [Colias croceus]
MKWSLLAIVILASAAPLCDALRLSRGLRVKFNVGTGIGTDFFFVVPQTTANAIRDGWSITARADSTRPNLVLYCPPDRVLCGFFTRSGQIAGLQIALAKDEFSDAVFDWETQGYTEWNPTPVAGETRKSFWTTQVFFVSETSSKLNEDIAPSSNIDVLGEDAIWVSGFNKEMVEIPADAKKFENSIFTKQSCIQWMGLHYYYNMTKETECTSDGIFPWFPLVNSGKLEGVGFLTVGKLQLIDGRRDWFERPDESVVRMIVPEGPECLYNLAGTVGVVTMHIYFTDEPYLIECIVN